MNKGKGIQQWFCNDKGATSVLVIFMMIVLVTLGTFSIASASVNYKFASRTADWNKMYYHLEDQAEKYVMEIDGVLAESAKQAEAYVATQGYTKDAYPGIDDATQATLARVYSDARDKEEALHTVLTAVYQDMAMHNLMGRDTAYTEQIDGMNMSTEFTSETDEDVHLSVTLQLTEMKGYNITQTAGAVSVTRAQSNPRYHVTEWREWQTPVVLDDEQGVWDGLTEPAQNPDVAPGKGIFDQP